MPHEIDPQISASIISTGGGLLTGVFGTMGAAWMRRRRRGTQDQRCERVCAKMVNLADTMLAVMKALGVNDPRLAQHIAHMEIQIHEARTFLDESAA